MTFVLNHLVNGVLGMSQSEFPMWVPLWRGVNEAGYYGAKSPCNTHQKSLKYLKEQARKWQVA